MTDAYRKIPYLPSERVAFAAVCSILLALFLIYIHLICATVVHVVIRKEAETSIAELRSEISTLEAAYIERQHAVSDEIALQQGYVAVAEKIFLERTDTTVVVSATR